MLEYRCDWCKRKKKEGEPWFVGLAAEKIGPAGHRLELRIAEVWIEEWAEDRLAVYFCSEKHKERYKAVLFGTRPGLRVLKSTTPTILGRKSHTSTLASAQALLERTGLSASRRVPPRRKPSSKARPRFSRMDQIRAHGLGITLGSPPGWTTD
jgi:hypothetical protein